MNTFTLISGIAAAVFAVIEYIQHREFNSKHPDQVPCPSGIYGYILLSIVLIIKSF